MTRCERKSVVLRDGVLWNRPFSASRVALLIMHLFNHDFRDNDQQVYPLLDIDMKTRRQQDNVPRLESERTHEYRIINKALAGELLSGLLLTHLNSASEIRAWCETRRGLPHKFAGPGFADLVARYQDTRNKRAFRLVTEVSAKRDVTAESFRTQLNQAWKRAEECTKDAEGGDVYALVVNGAEVGSGQGWSRQFQQFAEEKGMKPDGPIRIVPMYAGDLAAAMRRMDETLEAEGSRFTPALLAEILDSLFGMLLGTTARPDAGPAWMCDLWVEMAKREAAEGRQLGLGQAVTFEGDSAEPG